MADDRVTVDLYLRPFAWIFGIGFFVVLAVSAVVTFNATSYSPETDKITIFYQAFNPCIFFDHYPAKLVAAAGMGFLLVISICFEALMLVFEMVDRAKLFKAMMCAVSVTCMAVVEAMFVNVFTTNLYPETNPDRRLHGVHFIGNGTYSLVEDHSGHGGSTDHAGGHGGHHSGHGGSGPGGLSSEIVAVILLHTTFYVIWVVFHGLFSIRIIMFVHKHTGESWSLAMKCIWGALMLFGWLEMFLHSMAMLIIILYQQPQIVVDKLESGIQRFILTATETLMATKLGWLPILYHRLIVPKGLGVRFTFTTTQVNSECGRVRPEGFIMRSLAILSLIWCLGGVFHNKLFTDDSTWFQLSAAIRSKPYAYIAAPLWLLAVVINLWGTWLTCMQHKLQLLQLGTSGTFLVQACACVMSFSMFGYMLVIIEQERFTWMFGATGFVSFIALVVFINLREGYWIRPLIYAVSGLIIMSLALYSRIYFSYAFFVWLLFYIFAVPSLDMFVSIERLVDEKPKPLCGYESMPAQKDEA